MNKDKQIEEMGVITDLLIDFDEMGFAPTTACPDPEAYAIEWRNQITIALQGYRKASDLAREIFEEIDRLLENDENDFENVFEEAESEGDTAVSLALSNYVYGIRKMFAELKKKFTEDGK